MNLDCIAQYLINAKLATDLGTDIFEFHMPEDVPSGILLKTQLEGVPVNSYITDYFNGRYQVIVRNPSHATGDQIAAQVCKCLRFYEQTFLDGSGALLMHVLLSRPVSLPIVYPRSTGNLYEWSCNFMAHYIMPFQLAAAQITAGMVGNGSCAPVIVQS